MNYCQKRTITNCLGKILQFYQYGKEGLVLEPGGFVELFAARCPDLYEDNKAFILFLDKILVACCDAGRKSTHPPGE